MTLDFFGLLGGLRMLAQVDIEYLSGQTTKNYEVSSMRRYLYFIIYIEKANKLEYNVINSYFETVVLYLFENIIKSITKSVILFCGKKLYKRIYLGITNKKIKKNISNKIHTSILVHWGNNEYYDSLDAFLTKHNFAENIVEHCYYSNDSTIKSLNSYIGFIAGKFIEQNKAYTIYSTHIFHILSIISKIVFDTINDYSADENARLVIVQIKEMLENQNEYFDKILNEIQKDKTSHEKKNEFSLDDKTSIVRYKSSLASYFINEEKYIPRNIFTQNDNEQSSKNCLIENKQILLLGSPGCGKTYETYNLLKEFCTDKNFSDKIPIFIPLIEYGITYNTIVDRIKDILSPFFGALDKETINAKLKTNKFILILDGVDEILEETYRIRFFSDINQILSYTQAYCFITSRTNSYYGNIKNVLSFQIKGLTREEIRSEFSKHNLNINLIDSYYELFSNPLFLNIGIDVFKNNGGNKLYNKSQLFRIYIEEVCYKRDKSKQLPKSSSKNYYNILMLIGKLAFEKFEKTFLSFTEFDEFFGMEGTSYSTNNICDVFRIDVFNIDNHISFFHKQIKEYFAAFYLIKKYKISSNQEFYTNIMKDERWQEVIIFVAGLIEEIDEQNLLLDMILKYNLQTYIKCISFKNDLSVYIRDLSLEEYSKKYLSTLFDSYNNIVESYFSNIKYCFEPLPCKKHDIFQDKKICLVGCLSKDKKHLYYWFDWKGITENSVQLIDENSLLICKEDMLKRANVEKRSVTIHYTNLDSSNLNGDSARKVALNIIYKSIKKALDDFALIESEYIIYEKFDELTSKIKELKGETIEEISKWCLTFINNPQNTIKIGNETFFKKTYNNVDILELNQFANWLISKGYTHESLSLPGPDLPFENGWIWEVYSKGRAEARLKKFFLYKQLSFKSMIDKNFPKMNDYFSMAKDWPFRYKIHIKFKDTKNWLSDPDIMYYYISVGQHDSIEPEVIIGDPYPDSFSDAIFDEIRESFCRNGKEVNAGSVYSTGFSMVITSSKTGKNIPLTCTVYKELEDGFKKLFEN